MKLLEEAIRRSLPIWEACIRTSFVQGLKTGGLPPETFHLYLVQDGIYLTHYARVYGAAIHRCRTPREIRLFYDMLGFVTETESPMRLTDGDQPPLPACQRYLDFLTGAAQTGEPRAILMAVLPCMLSYSHIAGRLAAEPETARSPYWDFIQGYADEGYRDDCRRWYDEAGALYPDCAGSERERLLALFLEGSRLELDFWNMAEGGTER